MPPVKKPPHERARHFIRQWRDHRGLSQEALADRLEIDRSTLSKIENGLVPYNQDMLERAALALGCDPDELLSVNPKNWDKPRLVYSRMKGASPALQERILTVVEALLKAG